MDSSKINFIASTQPNASHDNGQGLPDDGRHPSQWSRRQSLKLFAALAASTLLPALSGCEQQPAGSPFTAQEGTDHAKDLWPQLKLSPIKANGYGKDPNLIVPPESPWPLTLTQNELALLAVVADWLVPREANAPSASDVGVPLVINEWVSAPYDAQQQDRALLVPLLQWLNDEAERRLQQPFTKADLTAQQQILDDIAFSNPKPAFASANRAFSRLRQLVVAAFFVTPEGSKDIGYLGNTAIAGDYPGPSADAYQHLAGVLSDLGLTDFAYPAPLVTAS